MPDLNVLLTLAGAVLLLVVPGLLLALALRFRGWAAAGIAPLLTFALVVIGIVVVSVLGIDWTPLSAAGVSVTVIAVAAGVGVMRRPDQAAAEVEVVDERRARLWSGLTVGGLLLGGAIGFGAVVSGTGDLTRPNQGFDALFHVNLIEIITRSGEVSPAAAGNLNGYPDGASVYPDAFHAMASLVDQLSGGSLVAINALLACIPLIGGLGLAGLLRSMGLVRAAAVVPVVLASTMGYTDLIWRGPIWVFVFGITFIPAFLLLLRLTLARRQFATTAAFGISTGALAVIHPSAALSAAVFGACLVGSRWLGNRATLLRDLLVLVPAALVAAVLALPLIGQALVDTSGGTVVDWPVAQSTGEVLGELLLFNYDNAYPQLWLAIPALIGLFVGWRYRELRWWYAATGIFVALCVAAAAYEGLLVQVFTGPWWNDRFRFAGVVFLGLSVFGAVGIVWLGRLVAAAVYRLTSRWPDRLPALRSSVVTAVGVAVVVTVVGIFSQGFYVQENRERLELGYVPGGGGAVSAADLAAFEVLEELAGDGPVLNDPNDGSAWMWALADVRPVFGAALTSPVKPPLPADRQLLIDGLNCLDSSEDVRQAVDDLGVRYVYSSETTILGGETPNVGFRDLSSVDSLRPVYDEGGATIYEIAPVALQESPAEACRLA